MTNMHSVVIIELDKNIDYWQFLREKPYWYRELSRHPENFQEFVKDYKIVRRKRVVDKVEDFSLMMTLARELL
ncbi:MAG: YlbE-like family protein [Bacilli bacterium]